MKIVFGDFVAARYRFVIVFGYFITARYRFVLDYRVNRNTRIAWGYFFSAAAFAAFALTSESGFWDL